MSSNKIYIAVAAVVLLLAAFFLFMGKGGSAAITLTASTDKATYASHDTVNLTVLLANSGTKGTCVSDTNLGNITFLSVTRDGKPVETRTATSYYLTSLSEMMQAKLAPLAPGATTEIALSSSQDPGLNANAFDAVASKGTYGLSTFYNIGAPGTYEVKIAYAYPGEASPDCPDVWKGPIEPATVTFTVTK